MDDVTEKKIRDLKLRLLKVEREINASQHNTNLGAWLRAGHASQMARAGERDRQRLEAKRDEIKAKIAELEQGTAPAPAAEKKAAAVKPAAAKTPEPKAGKKK